jgi:hypothetical protein
MRLRVLLPMPMKEGLETAADEIRGYTDEGRYEDCSR